MDIYELIRLNFAIQFMVWFFVAIKSYKEQALMEWRAKQLMDKRAMQFFKDVINIVAKIYEK